MPSIRSPRGGTRAIGLVLAALATSAVLLPLRARAQVSDAYLRAQNLEDHQQYEQAAAAYRAILAGAPASVSAVLGLERVYAQLGRTDSLLPVLEQAIAIAPRVMALRSAELRTLRTLGDRARLRAAFDRWRHDVPHDPAPYRDYARQLIEDGYTAAADTVLREAQADVGSGRGFAYELAQLHAAMGSWPSAAASWRLALTDNPYLDQAAVFSLLRAPPPARDAVRRALAGPPVLVAPMRVIAALDVEWGAPRAGWDALRTLRPDSAGLTAWVDFARRAEDAEAWLVARDALVAANDVRPSAELVSRAANDALSGGDAASAAALAARAEADLDSSVAARAVLPLHLRALGVLGRPEEATRLLAAYAPHLDPDQHARTERLLAWGWVRVGDLGRAKGVLAAAGDTGSMSDSLASGWIALYSGDLAAARTELRAPGGADAPPELLTALELLQRTRADRSPDVGTAFLTLARGDTVAAAAAFEHAAVALPDVGSLLLATAARLYAAHGTDARAIPLWHSIVQGSPTSPEAPGADLEWARALRRAGQGAAAADRLEHLILTYPESALVPQARRELELARHAVPATS